MTAKDMSEIQYITAFLADHNFLAQTDFILEHLMFGHSPKANITHVKHDAFHNF